MAAVSCHIVTEMVMIDGEGPMADITKVDENAVTLANHRSLQWTPKD